MTDLPESPRNENDYAEAVVESKKKHWSLVWLVPLIAILAGIGLVARTIMEQGPDIVVTFKTADGIEAGKTKVRYKSVEIGVVEHVGLSDDFGKIKATIRMSKSAEPLLVEDARFWVEKPRISGTSIEGLGTLLSGAFIGMDSGKSTHSQRSFEGLDRPPLITFTEPGRQFRLHASQLGSLDTGSQVFYRRVAVGQVVDYDMDKDGRGVSVDIFIKAPYDRFVNSETRFWEASGVDVELNARGIRVDTQSLNAILAGGIAFETRGNPDKIKPVEANNNFRLFERRNEAMTLDDTEVVRMRLVFNESVRGLSEGAPVDFRGIEIGRVVEIGGYIDPKQGHTVFMTVDVDLFPDRFRAINVKRDKERQVSEKEIIDSLVAGGLRAQLRTGNLVSGQLFVSLDFFKNAPKTAIKWDEKPPVLPTIPGSLVGFEQQVADLLQSANGLIKKLQALPLEQLSGDARTAMQSLDKALKTADGTLKKAEGTLQNADRILSEDSALQQDLRDALREVSRAAAEARVVLDYQSRYPESLIKGKPQEEKNP